MFLPPSPASSCKSQSSSTSETATSSRRSSTSSPEPPKNPGFTYSALIMMAIRSTPQKRMLLKHICEWIASNFPFYRGKRKEDWEGNVRHTLTLSKWFVLVPRPEGEHGRGGYWTISPAAEDSYVGVTTGRLRHPNDAFRSSRSRCRRELYAHPYYPHTVASGAQCSVPAAYAQQHIPPVMYLLTPAEFQHRALWQSVHDRHVLAMYQEHLQMMQQQQMVNYQQQLQQQQRLWQEQHRQFQQR